MTKKKSRQSRATAKAKTSRAPKLGVMTGSALWTSANLNDAVRFKLTEKGRAHVAELNRTHPVYSRVPLKYQPDAEGWIETQLWDFANVFGPTMGMGFDQTVETAIQLRRLCRTPGMSNGEQRTKYMNENPTSEPLRSGPLLGSEIFNLTKT